MGPVLRRRRPVGDRILHGHQQVCVQYGSDSFSSSRYLNLGLLATCRFANIITNIESGRSCHHGVRAALHRAPGETTRIWLIIQWHFLALPPALCAATSILHTESPLLIETVLVVKLPRRTIEEVVSEVRPGFNVAGGTRFPWRDSRDIARAMDLGVLDHGRVSRRRLRISGWFHAKLPASMCSTRQRPVCFLAT